MNNEICLIAPYEELKELGMQCNKKFNLNLDVKLANLEESILPAQQSVYDGTKVIISRGGTSSIIRENIHIPVVEIKVTGHDLLKSLFPYTGKNKKIAIVGYENVVRGCRTISEVLNIPIREIFIPHNISTNWKEIENSLLKMISKNEIDVIIGDTVVKNKFQNLGIDVHLIKSGEESILQAVEEAKNIIKVREKDEEKYKRFQAVLDFVSDAVIATDIHGTITVINPNAEKILNIKKDHAIGKYIDELIPNNHIKNVIESGITEIDQIQKTPKGDVIANRVPIIVDNKVKGVVITFHEVSKIQDMEQKIRQNLYAKGLTTKYDFNHMLTQNEKMTKVIEIAKHYAKTDATILIEGESGTGKEILAQSIHSESFKRKGPFVAINCAALPSQLLESELFGYVKGAFTGASKDGKIGLFELAHNGTIFLDEIGDLDSILQARLLRVLQEKEIMRIGSDKIVPVDIRVIAATNVNLRKMVADGDFREDLYYRLNVLNLHLSPLRERKEDIEYLCYHFLNSFNNTYRKKIETISPEVIDFLKNYHWRGNIRELKNVLERMVITTQKKNITHEDIDFIIEEIKTFDELESCKNSELELIDGTMDEIKKKIIKKILKQENNNKTRAAKRLGIDRSTITRFM